MRIDGLDPHQHCDIFQTTEALAAMKHHLVVLQPRYLASILAGLKSVECRLSVRRVVPFGQVSRGDVLWLKRSGGPIVARAKARRVTSVHPVTPAEISTIINSFGRRIRADARFFRARRRAGYATLIHLGSVTRLDPIDFPKRDRRAWVVLPTAPSISRGKGPARRDTVALEMIGLLPKR